MFRVLWLTEGHTQRGWGGSQILPQGLCMCFLCLQHSPQISTFLPPSGLCSNFTSSVRPSLTIRKFTPQGLYSQHLDQWLAHRKPSKMIYIQTNKRKNEHPIAHMHINPVNGDSP